LKQGEKEACWIVRIHEQRGRRSPARVRAPGYQIVATNLVEWQDGARTEGSAAVTLGPFEIRTYKLIPSRGVSR
jgi:alpha-mannosidase